MSESILWHDRPQFLLPHQSNTTATQHQLNHNQLVNFLRDEIGKAGTNATAVRNRDLAMNAGRVFTALALANIYLSRNRLMAQVRP
jgi:hypothetical protein